MLNLSNALEIVSGIIYFIKVRATNQWGSGSESAQVEFRLIGGKGYCICTHCF